MSDAMPPSAKSFNLRLDYRYLVFGLLAVIAAMLLIWKPWQSAKTTDRTVDVTGQSTISARPDEFIFYPIYDFTNSDKDAALVALTAKNNEIIAKLKALGVADKYIKTNASSWSYPIFKSEADPTPTYTLSFTITANSDKLAQKVQDYLVSTSPTGNVTPQANFSDQKRKELEDKARDEATKNARSKAEQSAHNLGFKLAAVKSVNDGAGFGGIYPTMGFAADLKTQSSQPSLTIQPGENDLSYTVTVTYFIK